MELSEKLDSNKMSAVQSFDMIVRSALIDHEDRIKKIERAERVRMNDAQMVRDSMAYDRETDDLRATPTVERFVMWENVQTSCSHVNGTFCQHDERAYVRRKRGEVVATLLEDRFWNVVFPCGGYQDMNDTCYQTLKRNGCFGEQVK